MFRKRALFVRCLSMAHATPSVCLGLAFEPQHGISTSPGLLCLSILPKHLLPGRARRPAHAANRVAEHKACAATSARRRTAAFATEVVVVAHLRAAPAGRTYIYIYIYMSVCVYVHRYIPYWVYTEWYLHGKFMMAVLSSDSLCRRGSKIVRL